MYLGGASYAARRSESSVDIEETDGVLNWALIERREERGGIGHLVLIVGKNLW
jgi:hypothetical protein